MGVLAERLLHSSRTVFIPWIAFILLATCGLAFFNQYIICCALAGFAFHWILRLWNSESISDRTMRRTWFACAGLILALLIVREWKDREFLPRTPFQANVVKYLAEVGDAKATIIPPFWDVEWSARTGAPVFLDYQTPRLITYMPSLGPSLRKMVRDIYGFNIDGTSNEGLTGWTDLTPEQWQALGDAYDIRYLVHLADQPCPLEPVFSENGLTLYAIPRSD